jgi:hypothetical protein
MLLPRQDPPDWERLNKVHSYYANQISSWDDLSDGCGARMALKVVLNEEEAGAYPIILEALILEHSAELLNVGKGSIERHIYRQRIREAFKIYLLAEKRLKKDYFVESKFVIRDFRLAHNLLMGGGETFLWQIERVRGSLMSLCKRRLADAGRKDEKD